MLSSILTFLTLSSSAHSLALIVDNAASTKSALSAIASTIVNTYFIGPKNGYTTEIPAPYYWWEAGTMMGGLVDYAVYTGDDQYNSIIQQGILTQAAPTEDFMLPSMYSQLGNDDQVVWALAAMEAAEYNFPVPQGTSPSIWGTLAENVHRNLASRWDTSTCGGGIRWQFIPSNSGYTYKSTICNGGFFQLSARLARYTGNSSYSDWANKAYDWMTSVNLITEGPTGLQVLDGATTTTNCGTVDQHQWSYNTGGVLLGMAVMHAITPSDTTWLSRYESLGSHALGYYFEQSGLAAGVMHEPNCEDTNTCNNDEKAFKALFARWASKATLYTSGSGSFNDALTANFEGTSLAAANGCSNSGVCSLKWNELVPDGNNGLGQQMSALEMLLTTMLSGAPQPATQ